MFSLPCFVKPCIINLQIRTAYQAYSCPRISPLYKCYILIKNKGGLTIHGPLPEETESQYTHKMHLKTKASVKKLRLIKEQKIWSKCNKNKAVVKCLVQGKKRRN
jgi:hypothetical protein